MSASKTPLYVVSWGWNDSGRCGNLTASEIRAPQQIQKQSRSVTVIDCCAGMHHSLLLSDEGLVYAIGDGRRGQLGIGNQFSSSNNNNEKPNSALQGIARQATPSGDYRNRCDIRASQIAAGGSFSLSKELSLEEGVDLVPGFSALESSLRRLRNMYSESEALQRAWAQVRHEKFMISSKSSGQVLVWGSGHHGELGLGPHLEAVPFPQPINTFTQNNISIRSIAAGMRHILAIDTNGRIYSWGCGRDGRLGHGDFSDRWVPAAVRFFNSLYVESCAAGDAHSVVVTTTRTGSRSQQLRRISAFGRGAHGRLGNGSNRNAPLPVLVSHWLPSLKSAQFHCVSCGGAHTVVLASLVVPVCLAYPFGLQTFVVTWGYGSNGQLGTGRNVDSFVPVKAKMPKSTVIVEVSAGRSWSMARSVAGELFVWGKGLRGQLGLGADKFSFGPRKVEYFASFLKISSNYAHNIGIAVPRKALNLPSAEALARTTHQGYDAFKHIVPLKLRSACSKSFFSFDCCRRSGTPAEAALRPLLRFHCLDCKINCICYHCARLCHRNHRLIDMDKSLFFEAHQVHGAADDDAAAVSSKHKLSLPYTSSIAKLDDYLKHVSIDKTHIEPLSHRCTVLYASNMHLLRPKRGRLEMMPNASLLQDIDPFSMALFTDTEYSEYEQQVQTEAVRRSKLKRKVIVIGKRKRHAAVAVNDSESNKSPVAITANDENRPSLTANKVKGVITAKATAENRRLSIVDAVPTGRGKRQAIESDGKGPARQARRSELKTSQTRGATASNHQQQHQQVVAPACHCGLFNRCCRVLPMIPEACEESFVEDTLSVRLECNRDYLSASIGIRQTAAMKSVSSIDNEDDVRNTRISQRYLRQRIGTRNIAARRIQRLARSFMKKMLDRRSLLRSIILRREVCSRHVTEFIIGTVFKKFDGVYESYRRDKERSYMQYEDHLMHSYDYYTRLQRVIVHIEALLFGTKKMFGSISPKLPRVAIDGRISSAWRPTNAFSWTSIRSQQLHLHPMRRVPVSLLAHVTKHIPRGNHRPSKEGILADADLTRFTNRFLRSIPYEKWRRRVAQLQSEKKERRRLIAQQALEKLKARQNYKKDLLAQAEAISLANQNKVNSAAKPPPGPPPRFVLVQAAEELKREKREQLERDIQQRLVVEDRDFSVQREYEQVLHPRRRHTLLDPMQLYSRLTGMRSTMVKSNKAKRRNSLPAQLSSLYVDFQQPTPRLRIAQISESLIMFEERLSALTSLCTSINGIKTSADPSKSLNRCYNQMLKVMSSPVLNPRIPLEMHHTLLDPNRRRSIAEPERLARQLSIMIDTREKFSEAIELSRRSGGLEINRRRRSFDVGERRDSEQGIELILGISYVEQRVATTTTTLINDSEYMNGRMIKAKMVEGDDASMGSASTSVLSNIVTEQDLQIRALQQQMQQPSPSDSSYGGASHKKKSISSLAAVRGSPSKTGLSKDQERWGLQVVAVGDGIDDDASITAGTYEGGDIILHFDSTLLEEGDSSSSQRVPAPTVMDVDPQLYHTWQEHYDSEGRAYYYNAFTDESSWELPADPATQIETQNQDELGNWYWFNSTTGAVVWMS